MEKFDHLILDAIAERIFSPDRLNVMMAELRKTVRDSQEIGQEQVNELNRQIKAAESRLNNLYDAVEKGLLPMDETLKKTGRPAANGKGCVARRVSKSAPRNVVTSGASVAEHG